MSIRWISLVPSKMVKFSGRGFRDHPAYGLDALRADLDRFTLLLGGNDGEFLLGEDQP